MVERIHPAQMEGETIEAFLRRRIDATSVVHDVINEREEKAQNPKVAEVFQKARRSFNLIVFKTNPKN